MLVRAARPAATAVRWNRIMGFLPEVVGGKIGPPPESQSNARNLLVRESDGIAGTIGGACWYSAHHHDSGAASAPDRRPQSSGR
jgi:hypothetical protein